MNTYIQLVEANQGYLDIKPGSAFPLTLSLGDIRDITKRNGSFSKTITLVGNKTNNELLGHYYDINIKAGTFNINTLQKCVVVQNGVTIMDNMYMQLVAVNKVQKTNLHDDSVEYSVLVKDSSSDFFTKIGGLLLTDIDLSEYNHINTTSSITNSYDNTYVDGYKYLLPYNGTTSIEYDISDLNPAIYTRTLWDKIFANAGYTYEFDEASDEYIQFNKLIHPYNGDVPKPVDDPTTWTIVENTTGQTLSWLTPPLPPQLLDVPTVVQDENGDYTPATSDYTLSYDLATNDSIVYEFEITYDSYLINNIGTSDIRLYGYDPVANIHDPNYGVNIRYATTYNVRKNNESQANYSVGYGIVTEIDKGTIIASGATHPLLTNHTEVVTVKKSGCLTGDILDALINLTTYVGSQPQEWKESGSPTTGGNWRPEYHIDISEIKITIKPSIEAFLIDSTITLNSFIAKKVKQSDFIKSIAQMYNLYIETDRTNTNNLIIKTRDSYYDAGVVVDWTSKLAKDKDQNIKFLPELSSKKMVLSYKADSDTPNKQYQDTINKTYGQIEYVFDNEYVKKTERKELIFAPTPNRYTAFNANVPIIIGRSPKTKLKILLDGGELSCLSYTIRETTTTSTTLSTYPFLSHFNDAENPTFDINFGICDYYYYNPDNLTNNNLYNIHWRRTFGQINDGKLLKAQFNLNAVDINQLRLNDKIRIDNSYWNINKVIDYNANTNDLTTVELISTDDEIVLPAFNSFGVVAGNNTGDVLLLSNGDAFLSGIGNPLNSGGFNPGDNINGGTLGGGYNRYNYSNIDQSNGNTFITGVYNQTSTVTEGSVYGDSNLINAPGVVNIQGDSNTVNSTSWVIGDDNTVDENLYNVFLFVDGYSATTSNLFVIPETLVLDGDNPTINGIPLSGITGPWEYGDGVNSIQTIDNNNLANADGSIAQGENNSVKDTSTISAIIGGEANVIQSGSTQSGILAGGDHFITASSYGAIVGGIENDINTASDKSGIFVGEANEINTSTNSVIVGGTLNVLTGSTQSSILGGEDNTLSGSFISTMVGGYDNLLTNGFVSTMVGGESNIILDSAYASILGGHANFIEGDGSTITGGESNSILLGSTESTILGGQFNTIDNVTDRSTILGGQFNTIDNTSNMSSIAGGGSNTIDNSSLAAFIGGGGTNLIDNGSTQSSILGGTLNIISGTTTSVIVGGSRNKITDTALSVIIASASLDTAIVGTYQQTLYHQDEFADAFHTLTTNNVTTQDLYTFVPTEGVFIIETCTTGFETATGNAFTAKQFASFKVIGGVVTQISTTSTDRKSDFAAAIQSLLDTDGTNIRIRVRGKAVTIIDWRTNLTITR